jgi:hypothetical protein
MAAYNILFITRIPSYTRLLTVWVRPFQIGHPLINKKEASSYAVIIHKQIGHTAAPQQAKPTRQQILSDSSEEYLLHEKIA